MRTAHRSSRPLPIAQPGAAAARHRGSPWGSAAESPALSLIREEADAESTAGSEGVRATLPCLQQGSMLSDRKRNFCAYQHLRANFSSSQISRLGYRVAWAGHTLCLQ